MEEQNGQWKGVAAGREIYNGIPWSDLPSISAFPTFLIRFHTMRLSLFLLASALGLPLLAAAMPGGRSPYFYRRADQEAMTSEIPIHASCNASQAMQLRRGIFDTKRLAREAADHLFKHGNTSELFQTYFGSAADPAVPIGIYERILEVDTAVRAHQTLIWAD